MLSLRAPALSLYASPFRPSLRGSLLPLARGETSCLLRVLALSHPNFTLQICVRLYLLVAHWARVILFLLNDLFCVRATLPKSNVSYHLCVRFNVPPLFIVPPLPASGSMYPVAVPRDLYPLF